MGTCQINAINSPPKFEKPIDFFLFSDIIIGKEPASILKRRMGLCVLHASPSFGLYHLRIQNRWRLPSLWKQNHSQKKQSFWTMQ